MHPVVNGLYGHLDSYTAFHSLSSLCLPFSLLLGTAVLAKATNAISTAPPSRSRKRKRGDETKLDSNYDSSDQFKKARLTESSSLDEVEMYLSDTTLIDEYSEYDNGEQKTHKPITITLLRTPTKPAGSRLDAMAGIENQHGRPINGCLSPHSVAISAISPSRRALRIMDEDPDISAARHEWELRWFVCVHHAAFTAATGMCLRREIRRRKTLARMWRDIRKENMALRENVRKLTLELHGFVEM